MRLSITAVILFATCASLFAVTDTVTHYDDSGIGQSNYPIFIRRGFADNEFCTGHYPQAQVGGVSIATQVNVLSSWPSGCLKQAILNYILPSIAANGSTTVTFVPQNSTNTGICMNSSQMLLANGGVWDAVITYNGMFSGNLTSVSARTMLNTLSSGGSVQPSSNIESLGLRYTICGSLVTQVVIEDRNTTLAYDTGLDANKALHPAFIITFWPSLSLGVEVIYETENGPWYNHTEDQHYSFNLTDGTTTLFTSPGVVNFGYGSKWIKCFWVAGSAPNGWNQTNPYNGAGSMMSQGIHTDLNLAYMISALDVPNYDTTTVISNTGITNEVNYYTAHNASGTDPEFSCYNGLTGWCGSYQQALDSGGPRPELGWQPRWFTNYFYSHDSRLLASVYGNGNASLVWPGHFRGTNTSGFYDRAHTTSDFGLPVSLIAYPTAGFPGCVSGGTCTLSAGFNFAGSADEHLLNLSYPMFLLGTSDWYVWWEDVQFLNVYEQSQYFVDPGSNFARNNDWGNRRFTAEPREAAWPMEHLGHAVWSSIDGTLESTYWLQQLAWTAAIWEGALGITGNLSSSSSYGLTTPSGLNCAGFGPYVETSQWRWGYCLVSTYSGKSPPDLGGPGGANNPIGIATWGTHAQTDYVPYMGIHATTGVTDGTSTAFNITNHQLINGETVAFQSSAGAGNPWNGIINNYTVTLVDANNFTLNLNSSGFGGALPSEVWLARIGRFWQPLHYDYGYQEKYLGVVLGHLQTQYPTLYNNIWKYFMGWLVDLMETAGNDPYHITTYPIPLESSSADCALDPVGPTCKFQQTWAPWTTACEANNGMSANCIYHFPFVVGAVCPSASPCANPQAFFMKQCNGNPTSDYTWLARAALSFYYGHTTPVGGTSGTAAWNWLTTSSGCTFSGQTVDPSWNFVPAAAAPPGQGLPTVILH